MSRAILSREEYAPAGLVPLFVALMPPYQLLLRGRRSLEDVAELRGMKIRVPGDTGLRICRALGATGVPIDQADLYIALERGTVDGALQTGASSAAFHLHDVADALTLNARLGSVACVHFINADTFSGLDAHSRAVLREAGRRTSRDMLHRVAALIARDNRRLAENGMALLRLSEAVLAKFAAQDILPARTTAQWRALFDALDIPSAPANTLETLMADPHLQAVGLFRHYDHPSEGPMLELRSPFRAHGVPQADKRPPPRAGEHSAEILSELGLG